MVTRRFMDQSTKLGQCHQEMKIKGFRVACGRFISTSDVEKEELEREGAALVPKEFRNEKDIFAARGRGTSMEPKIEDGWWLIFRSNPVGTRQDRIVLVEDQSKIGGDRYTLKKYHSTKINLSGDTWIHRDIVLLPLNRRDHTPIQLEEEGSYRIRGWYIGHVCDIQRTTNYRYELCEI